MKIATWNVNSIKARLPIILDWLGRVRPDIVLLQETKCRDEDFPGLEIAGLGYTYAASGQKSYNGVAILARQPITDITIGLPGDLDDVQARYIEGTVDGLRVASLYLPNGNPVATDKFAYKLAWLGRLRGHAMTLLDSDRPFVLGGDYNVCPTDIDVYDPVGWRDDALCRAESRAGFRALLHLGLTDAFRALHPDQPHAYTFWDYQDQAWPLDHGLRIDHLLLSPQAADRLQDCAVDREPRGRERASDHTPIWCEVT